MFFSEEKNQKTFMACASGAIQALTGNVEAAAGMKGFCFFLSKKKPCPVPALHCRRFHPRRRQRQAQSPVGSVSCCPYQFGHRHVPKKPAR
jgi:hypothetical protein